MREEWEIDLNEKRRKDEREGRDEIEEERNERRRRNRKKEEYSIRYNNSNV